MKISRSMVFDCVMVNYLLHPGNVYSCLLSDVFFSLISSEYHHWNYFWSAGSGDGALVYCILHLHESFHMPPA